MSDPTRSFLDLLAEAGVVPRLLDGDRIAAGLGHLPPVWAAEVRWLLSTYRAEVVAELRARLPRRSERAPARLGSFPDFASAVGGTR